jgi:hypothetical protein
MVGNTAGNALMNWRRCGAHRETVHQNCHCLRRRFSVASFVPSAGCGLPVTTTGVPLQTSHKSMHAHQQHAIVGG